MASRRNPHMEFVEPFKNDEEFRQWKLKGIRKRLEKGITNPKLKKNVEFLLDYYEKGGAPPPPDVYWWVYDGKYLTTPDGKHQTAFPQVDFGNHSCDPVSYSISCIG